jgi:DnaJ-class molecular chaperone
VLLDLPLSVPEAILGAKVDIPTLGGTSTLTIPPGTSSGAKLRLRAKGITRNDVTGDMYAVVRIVVPRSPGAALNKLLEQHGDAFGDDPRRELGWTV